MKCVVNYTKTPVIWLKDEKVLSKKDNVTIKNNNGALTLVVQESGIVDSGTYVCRIGEEIIKETSCLVTVQGNRFTLR